MDVRTLLNHFNLYVDISLSSLYFHYHCSNMEFSTIEWDSGIRNPNSTRSLIEAKTLIFLYIYFLIHDFQDGRMAAIPIESKNSKRAFFHCTKTDNPFPWFYYLEPKLIFLEIMEFAPWQWVHCCCLLKRLWMCLFE